MMVESLDRDHYYYYTISDGPAETFAMYLSIWCFVYIDIYLSLRFINIFYDRLNQINILFESKEK